MSDRGSPAVPLLAGDPPRTVPGVVGLMEEIARALPAGDGLAAFNAVYLQVTERILSASRGGFFADRTFLDALDVTFAHRYFTGAAVLTADPVPACWSVLLSRRRALGPTALQFALAGMNAHISHDLPLAVVETCTRMGLSTLERARTEYFRVDALLEQLESQIRPQYLHRAVDRAAGVARLEDVLGCWSITTARAAAWENAEVLWHLRSQPGLSTRFARTLDAGTAAVSTVLLTPLLGELQHLPQRHVHLRKVAPYPGTETPRQPSACC